MSSRPSTEIPRASTPALRWAANAAAGGCALLLGLVTGERVCAPFLQGGRSPGAAWSVPVLPRPGDGGAGLMVWATALAPVACNLVALVLFAVVLLPVLRRRPRPRGEFAWPEADGRGYRTPEPSSSVLTAGTLRLQPGEAAEPRRDRWEKERDQMLRKVFEENLSLRR